jgi:hypothetical protein
MYGIAGYVRWLLAIEVIKGNHIRHGTAASAYGWRIKQPVTQRWQQPCTTGTGAAGRCSRLKAAVKRTNYSVQPDTTHEDMQLFTSGSLSFLLFCNLSPKTCSLI